MLKVGHAVLSTSAMQFSLSHLIYKRYSIMLLSAKCNVSNFYLHRGISTIFFIFVQEREALLHINVCLSSRFIFIFFKVISK